MALEFPGRAQRASPREQPAVQARLARNLLGTSHLRPPLRLPPKDRLARQPHQPTERRRVHATHQQDRTLRHHRVNVRVRAHRLEKSAVGEAGQGKQNPRAADLERSGAQGVDRRKLNRRGVALNFRENLLRRIGNLRPKQQVPVKEPGKEHQSGLTGSQKDLKVTHPLRTAPANSNKEPSPHSKFHKESSNEHEASAALNFVVVSPRRHSVMDTGLGR